MELIQDSLKMRCVEAENRPTPGARSVLDGSTATVHDIGEAACHHDDLQTDLIQRAHVMSDNHGGRIEQPSTESQNVDFPAGCPEKTRLVLRASMAVSIVLFATCVDEAKGEGVTTHTALAPLTSRRIPARNTLTHAHHLHGGTVQPAATDL